MNARQFEIEFYGVMAKWVAGGKIGPDPRGEWVYSDSSMDWITPHDPRIPDFSGSLFYRWKPAKKRTVVIDSVELVAPEVDAPKFGFYVEAWPGNVTRSEWGGHEPELRALANGKVFLTREDCQAMADFQRKQRLGGLNE